MGRIALVLPVKLSGPLRDPDSAINRLYGKARTAGATSCRCSAQLEVETWKWQLHLGGRYQVGADPTGWHGQLIVLEGSSILELAPGEFTICADCYLFDSAQAHAFTNRGKVAPRFFRNTVS